jgi:hypothetical protein
MLIRKVIAVNHSNLILVLVLGSALLSLPLVLSSTISDADARRTHIKIIKESNKGGTNQTNTCNNTLTCISNNMATTILCQHATCIIGDITPTLVPNVH